MTARARQVQLDQVGCSRRLLDKVRQKGVVRRRVPQANDSQPLRQPGEVPDGLSEPIDFLELDLTAQPPDLGGHFPLSKVRIDVVGYPLPAVATASDVFHRSFVCLLDLQERAYRTTVVRCVSNTFAR